MSQDIHENDIGTVFRILANDAGTPVDITDFTTLQVILQEPNGGTTTAYDAILYPDGDGGADGLFQYTVDSTTILTPPGRWRLQGRVAFSAEQDWKSEILDFQVVENL